MWVLIVSVPDHCLSFYFAWRVSLARRWSSNETPHPAVAHQRVKLSWHYHQSKGVLFQIFQGLFAISTSPVSGGFC